MLLEKKLFYRSLKESNSPSPFYEAPTNVTIYDEEHDKAEKIPYIMNSHGYRSAEFDKNNEILVLGCSQTYGKGLHNEFSWPEIFANRINQKYSRLAFPGDSIVGQVYKAFKYFEEIGNPKIVLALFPLFRLEYVSVPGKFKAGSSNYGTSPLDHNVISNGIAYFESHLSRDLFVKFSKAPHDPEQVIPKEFVIFYNFMFIKMLEQYCESHNIKFIWSIYEYSYIDEIIMKEPKISKNYLETLESRKLDKCLLNKEKDCAKEHQDNILYKHAADYNKKNKLGHWGIHLHSHMAETFIKKYMEIQNDK
jgi:hypothetical protein